MGSSFMYRLTDATLVTALVACSGSAGAQEPVSASPIEESAGPSATAERLFREGRDAVKRGDYTAACPKFEESQRLDPANGTLLNLALCEEGWGHVAEARAHFALVLAAPDLDAERRAIATDHAAALDRAERPAASTVSSPPRESETPTAVKPVATAPVPEPRSGSGSRAAAYLLGGVGLVSLATSAVTGILVIERADTVSAHCQNKLCDDEGFQAAASGRTLSAVSTVTFGAGVALTSVSLYLLLKPSSEATSSQVGVRGIPGGSVVGWTGKF